MSEQQQGPKIDINKSEGITSITVAGFKSIVQEQRLEVRPLTILAGANSSGKSSIMQPLLLLKQTLDATYDPGALLLNGPNVRFTSADQILSKTSAVQNTNGFHVGIETSDGNSVVTYFERGKNRRLDVVQTTYGSDAETYRLYRNMNSQEINTASSTNTSMIETASLLSALSGDKIILARKRCFLTRTIGAISLSDTEELVTSQCIRQIIHLPGLRGNPERTYPATAVGPAFPGTFEKYTASIINQWQSEKTTTKLDKVNRDLARLGLTGGVRADSIDDTQVELLVHRYLRGDEFDPDNMVSIADVGLGISQTLPVIVALHAASEGQLVYIEQPELHLHPRAQSAMAEVLAEAALQGTRMVVETHSSLFLLGIQTLVAEGKLPPEMVKLHWFQLLDDGSTQIVSADLDETGAFGDWPEDFADVALSSEGRYLDAAQARMMKGQ